MNHEIEYEDYVMSDAGPLGSLTRVMSGQRHIGDFGEWDDAIEAIREDMKNENFFPNVWYINDHGNVDQVSMNEPEAESYFFTFGSSHFTEDGECLLKSYVLLEGDFEECRSQMVDARGAIWAFQYPASDLDRQKEAYGLKPKTLEEVRIRNFVQGHGTG